MSCNCNRNGDVEYTITLNQQGPQGRQGNAGQNGFSPIVTVQSNTEANYQLKIISADGEIVTPNLKGQSPSLDGVVTTTGRQSIRGTKIFEDITEFNSAINFYAPDDSNATIQKETFGLSISSNGIILLNSVPFAGGKQLVNNITGDEYINISENNNGTIGISLNNSIEELADDVVAINSALGGLSFKKYTAEEYASIANPDANTLYIVTNPDGNTFKLYLGSIELEGGGGGTVVSGDNQFKTYLGNVTASVEAEPQI